MYFSIMADPFHDRGVLTEQLPDNVHLMNGQWVSWQPKGPIICTSNCDADNPPRHYMGGTVPIWSGEMLEVFKASGLDNIQAFPATIIEEDGDMSWSNYFIINVLGLLAAADMNASEYIEIGEHPSGLPYVGFQKLVLDNTKTHGSLFFRLAESRTKLIVHEQIVDYLGDHPPSSGSWGILLDELDSQ